MNKIENKIANKHDSKGFKCDKDFCVKYLNSNVYQFKSKQDSCKAVKPMSKYGSFKRSSHSSVKGLKKLTLVIEEVSFILNLGIYSNLNQPISFF